MRKIYLFMMVSLDGYFEGPNHDLSWHNTDEEFGRYTIEQSHKVKTILFGRKTYEMMASYWPTEDVMKSDPIVARFMNTSQKIVFSKSLKKLPKIKNWVNTKLRSEISVKEIKKLKEQMGTDIAIFGSNNLCVNLMKMGLVDEFRIMINPLLLGSGSRLFQGFTEKVPLTLGSMRTFKNGNILLNYHLSK